MNKRFELTIDGKCVVDNFTKEVAPDMESIVRMLNKNWNQTLRFEKYNEEYLERCNKYEEKIEILEKENEDLQQFKNLADDYNIDFENLYHICEELLTNEN